MIGDNFSVRVGASVSHTEYVRISEASDRLFKATSAAMTEAGLIKEATTNLKRGHLSRKVKTLIASKADLRRRLRHAVRSNDQGNDYSRLLEQLSEVKTEINDLCASARKSRFKSEIEEATAAFRSKDSSDGWQFIKRFCARRSGVVVDRSDRSKPPLTRWRVCRRIFWRLGLFIGHLYAQMMESSQEAATRNGIKSLPAARLGIDARPALYPHLHSPTASSPRHFTAKATTKG
jgi:hypothetical protein